MSRLGKEFPDTGSTIKLPGEAVPLSGFSRSLQSNGPAPDRADKLQLYAWLVGSWDMEVVVHREGGDIIKTAGTIDADWVLEGRAIQDVFAVPGMFYGSSLRFYDPHIDAWQVFWIDPLKQVFFRMIGRRNGNDILNEGKETPELARAYGSPEEPKATVRWSFTEITGNSFHWLSHRSVDNNTWQLQREYFARRRAFNANHQLPKAG